jgi:ketosteroid isomerase-like protein
MKMSEARNEIVNTLRKMSQLVPKADSVGLASHYSVDTVVMPPNTGVIQGRPAVKAFWDYGFKEFGYKEMDFQTGEVVSFGAYAIERGAYTFKAQPKGQGVVEDRGKYVTIWKYAPEGWLIYWDIFNSDLQPPK